MGFEFPQIALRSGDALDRFGVGTYKLENDEAERIVAAAIELGYRHIDTAKLYRNEEGVGRAVKQAIDAGKVQREELFITSKLWHDDHLQAEKALEGSLERAGLDYLDLFLIHWPTPKRGTAPTAWKGLIKAQERGLVRNIGVSNFEILHLEQIISETGIVPAVNQIELHPHHQRRELVDYCRALGIVVEAWSPLARGRATLLQDSAVTAAANAHGKTPAQIVLRWHVQHDFVVFPKTRSVERLKENAAIFDFELTAAEMTALDALERAEASGSNPFDMNG
ncbi:aldo/keto reductase [Canibacter zhoujuaniae]|uniref:aldo/keto reductase n=1 Tax=Canibacter zhoujuaniae TaxID=2708343 RepID=UPI00141E4F02|nr:aldo/keto reductase [Canibacter zhoujuaniae]